MHSVCLFLAFVVGSGRSQASVTCAHLCSDSKLFLRSIHTDVTGKGRTHRNPPKLCFQWELNFTSFVYLHCYAALHCISSANNWYILLPMGTRMPLVGRTLVPGTLV